MVAAVQPCSTRARHVTSGPNSPSYHAFWISRIFVLPAATCAPSFLVIVVFHVCEHRIVGRPEVVLGAPYLLRPGSIQVQPSP
jgi:hypothetical protein